MLYSEIHSFYFKCPALCSTVCLGHFSASHCRMRPYKDNKLSTPVFCVHLFRCLNLRYQFGFLRMELGLLMRNEDQSSSE